MQKNPSSVNILGGGLAGSLMAVFMAQKGYQVQVYERRPDMRKNQLDGGRSINLALSVRGMYALEQTGMYDEIMELAIPMYGRMMHARDATLNFQSYSKDEKTCIYSVSRAELNMRLMSLSESLPGVTYHFEQKCEDVEFDTGKVWMRDLNSGEKYLAPADISMACDGAFSAVRYDMQKTPRFNFSQHYLEHGYKELTIPPGPDGSFQMEKNALHIWPRGSFMMIALPNLDGSFTCTLFFPYKGEYGFDNLDTEEKVMAFFQKEFPDAVPLIPDLLEDFFTNPTSSLVTIRCFPWVYEDKVALMGDASHAIVPFFGQGMNAAFEDCTVMSAFVDLCQPDFEEVFERYQVERKVNAEAIADMALENFIEMRDSVGNPEFLFRKEVEHRLERHFPDYVSRYELVSFSRIPYAEAYQRGLINQQILDELLEGIDSVEEVDMEKAGRLIEEKLSKFN